MAFTILLRAAGNPDFGEPLDIGVPPRKVSVPTLQAAARVALDYIARHDLGGGNWIGGQVFDAKGRQVAHVSYNGRIWAHECGTVEHELPRGMAVGRRCFCMSSASRLREIPPGRAR